MKKKGKKEGHSRVCVCVELGESGKREQNIKKSDGERKKRR